MCMLGGAGQCGIAGIKERITRCPFQGVQETGVCGKSSTDRTWRVQLGRGIIFAVLPIQLCVRRKAAFNKSLIKGKQRGCRLSSSLSLDYLSFFLFFIFPCFSRIPDRSSFSVSRLLVYPRHARLISPLSFSVFYARRDYVAGQNMGYRGREE